jgi:hypothetical protein
MRCYSDRWPPSSSRRNAGPGAIRCGAARFAPATNGSDFDQLPSGRRGCWLGRHRPPPERHTTACRRPARPASPPPPTIDPCTAWPTADHLAANWTRVTVPACRGRYAGAGATAPRSRSPPSRRRGCPRAARRHRPPRHDRASPPGAARTALRLPAALHPARGRPSHRRRTSQRPHRPKIAPETDSTNWRRSGNHHCGGVLSV